MVLARRKGQFFVLSAVVVVISLFLLTNGLESGQDIKPGVLQEAGINSMLNSIHDGINQTVNASTATTIADNLELFLLHVQQEQGSRGRTFTYNYTISWPAVVVTTTLESDIYLVTMNYP